MLYFRQTFHDPLPKYLWNHFFIEKFEKQIAFHEFCLEFSEISVTAAVCMLYMADPSDLLGSKHSEDTFILMMSGHLPSFLGMKLSLSMHVSAGQTIELELLVTKGTKRNSHGKPKANILLPIYCSHIEMFYRFQFTNGQWLLNEFISIILSY